MASKKTPKSANTKSKAAIKKAPVKKVTEKKVKPGKVDTGPRHPHGRLEAAHKTKADLAKLLAAAVARTDEDTDLVEARLKTASNAQLLRLQKANERVKQKYGSRDQMIEAITKAEKKGADKDYLAKLGSYSLPQLLDLATSSERRARS